jgi:2-methylcitrate dehydratase PrpD
MNFIEEWADYIVQTRFSDADRKMCSQHVKDTLSALICGHYTSEGRQLIHLARNGRLWPKDKYEDDFLGQIMMTCSITRLTEIDDIHLTSCVTPGSVIIPAVVSLGWDKSLTRVDSFFDAILVGYEAMIRLGEAIHGAEILYKGIWPTYFCAPFGSAAAAARFLDLSVQETAHALTYALTLSTGGTNRGKHSTIRWLTLGQAAKTGVWSALLASQGMKANPASITHEWFKQTFGLVIDPSRLTIEQGQNSMIHSISVKPYCSAKQVMPSITGLQKIMARGLNPDEIQRVNIFVPPQFYTMVNQKPHNRLSSLTSVPYQLALTVFHPQALYDVDRARIFADQRVATFMDNVRVQTDEKLAVDFPSRWPTRVEVITSQGIFKEWITSVPGDPDSPFTEEQINEKIHRFLDPLWGENASSEFIRLNDQSVSDMKRLPRLLEFMHQFHFQLVENE